MTAATETALTARFQEWESRRSCGTCTACCFIHAVVAVPSAAYRWCRHCTPGKGCGVYDTRPPECRGYYCLWRLGFGTDEDRPDRGGMVCDLTFAVGDPPLIVVWRPLEESPAQLPAAMRMADEAWQTLTADGVAPRWIEFRGLPPTTVVRWEPERRV